MAEPSSSPHQNTTTTTTAATTVTTTTTTALSWGTLEELLLACAVHRYGTNSWDSIARELQNRTTFSLFTPNICQQKYRDLKKRFGSDNRNADETAGGDDAPLCLDELRRLRVAELRRDLQRYDHSIVSLQLKVKKLKEERENSVKDESDLEKNQENSTEKEEPEGQNEPDPVEPVKDEPDVVDERGGDSCNGSSNSKENREGEGEGRRRERVDSGELVESVAESKDGGEREEGVKENSDVQSTARLWRSVNKEGNNNNNNKNNNNDKREKKLEVRVISGSSSGEENQSPGFRVSESDDGKSQPLIEFLDVVRARKLGSYFERRLQSQETPKYTNLVRQHIDLETIQRKLEEGQYADCHTKFYRDLMLLINNAIIFFSERSSEHRAALELRQLLDKQFKRHLSPPLEFISNLSKPAQPALLPKPSKLESSLADSTDVKPKLTITGPVIACKKRSSITGKSSRTRGERKELSMVTPSSEKPLALEMVKHLGEKASSKSLNSVTKKRSREQSFGARSSSNKNHNSNLSPKTPANSSKVESSEAKGDKRKPSQGNSISKLKQWSGSDKNTLLELLKNSDKRKTTHNSSGGSVKSDRRKDEGPLSKLVKEKAKGREDRESPGSRNNRRPPKRAAAVATSKRGRNGGGEAESQSRKRERK